MSKRGGCALAEAPAPKRARIDTGCAAADRGWDDLVEDAKCLIRAECPLYARFLLGMTCKSEYAVETRPAPDCISLAQSLLVSPAFTLMRHVNLGHMLESTYHVDILHHALLNATAPCIKWLLLHQDEEEIKDAHYPREGLVPCPFCFDICAGHFDQHRLLSSLVDALIQNDEVTLDAVEKSTLDAVEVLRKLVACRYANDWQIARFCRRFF